MKSIIHLLVFCATLIALPAHAQCQDTEAVVRITKPALPASGKMQLFESVELQVLAIEKGSAFSRFQVFLNDSPVHEDFTVDHAAVSGDGGVFELNLTLGPMNSDSDIEVPFGDYFVVVKAVTENDCVAEAILPTFGKDSRVRAIVIGISDYDQISPLDYADDDANEFVLMLRRLFPTDNEIKIIPLVDKIATRENILAQLEDATRELSTESTLIVYFSGHGMIERHFEDRVAAYLAASNSNSNRPEITMINKKDLIERRLIRSRAKNKIFILDSCFGGVISAANNPAQSPGLRKVLNSDDPALIQLAVENRSRLFGLPQGVVGLVSSSGDTVSYESHALVNGIFTYYLLESIKVEVFQRQQDATFDDVITYIKSKIKAEHSSIQDPQLLVTPVDHKNKIFVNRPETELLQ